MAKKKENKDAIYGGEEVEIVEEKKVEPPKAVKKEVRLINAHGFQRVELDGKPHIMLKNICNNQWICVEEAKEKKGKYAQGSAIKAYEVDRKNFLS